MKSIGREKELERVIRYLQSSLDEGGSAARGSQVHISVGAPKGGGLSTFMRDLEEQLYSVEGLRPIRVEIGDSENPEKELLSVQGALAEEADLERAAVFGINELFSACNAYFAKTRSQVALLIDAGDALDAIHDDPDLRSSAKRNRLLYILRYMGTLMQDQLPRLCAVVAWSDRFPPRSSDWDAQDVVQRYYPTVWLRPHFGLKDPWPTYREILEAGDIEVEGNYPGFCRADIPVGDVLEQLRSSRQRKLTGARLLSILSEQPGAPAITNIPLPEEVLIALCLSDETIAPGEPHWESIERLPARDRYVTAVGDSRYGATSELYESVGTKPSSVVLALEERIRSRVEDRDETLVGELVRGLVRVLGVELLGDPEERDGFCHAQFRLDDTQLRPSGSRRMTVDVYATLAEELPAEMRQEVTRDIGNIAATPGGWANRCVLALSLQQDAHSHRLRMGVREASANGRITRSLKHWESKLGSREASVAGLISHQVDVNDFIHACYKLADPAHSELRHLEEVGKSIRSHFNSIQKRWPAITHAAINPELLSYLCAHSYEDLSIDDIAAALNIPKTQASERIKSARSLGILPEERRVVRWSYSADTFLEKLIAISERDGSVTAEKLHPDFFFDDSSWIDIAAALAHGYGDFFELTDTRLTPKSALPALERRATALLAAAKRACEALTSAGDSDASDRFGEQIQSLDAEITAADGAAELHKAAQGVARLSGQISANLALVDKRRHALTERLSGLASSLEQRSNSGEPSIEERRQAVLSRLAKLSESKPRLDELSDLIGSIENLSSDYEAADLARSRNQATARRALDEARQVDSVRRKICDSLSDSRLSAPLVGELEAESRALSEVEQEVDGIAREHPDEPPDVTAAKLGNLRARLGYIGDSLGAILQRSRTEVRPVRPSTRTPDHPAEPEPGESYRSRPVTGPGVDSGVREIQSEDYAGSAGPHNTESPAAGAVPGGPVGSTEDTPTRGNADSWGSVGPDDDLSPDVPAKTAGYEVAEASPTTRRVERRFGRNDVERLAELLESNAHIVSVTVHQK